MVALSLSLDSFQPYGLVSLWKMLELYAREFVICMQALYVFESALQRIHLKDENSLIDDELSSTIVSQLRTVHKACFILYVKSDTNSGGKINQGY